MNPFKKQRKEDKKKQEELEKKFLADQNECQKEILPILNKYDLDISARIKYLDNGLIAVPRFTRKSEPEKKEDTPVA